MLVSTLIAVLDRRATIVSGGLFLGACALFGLSGDVSAGVAVALLVVGSLVHVAGELGQASASFLLGASLATAPAVAWAVRSKQNLLTPRVSTREYGA